MSVAVKPGSIALNLTPGCDLAYWTASDAGREVRELLVAWRNDGHSSVRDRFRRSVDEGDLPPETDPGLLARCLTTFASGLAVQAASGVCRDELQEAADAFLRTWPLS
ncbi:MULTISPECIES: TetR family transcriptional regulator C-terminal domain-containing protein [unclassified Streptomyces]|uniref:TetR family transcriptional regulator C-terminal domain-containing protein n=1 Tax=unclassified Streptomyces TaxID=2593676 RepID=UPI0027818DA9|nr:TetR family transcriptional regulator C-terminal domain-containing protein [Streptomyces sp. DSM 40167]MDQ0401663.1 hypothetical protein [Streptomyces sp. DSM 40167]